MSVGKSITTEKSSASMKNMYIVNLSGLLLHSHISHVLDTLTGSYLMKSSSVLDGDLFAWEDSHMFNIKEPNSITPEEAVTVKRIAAVGGKIKYTV